MPGDPENAVVRPSTANAHSPPHIPPQTISVSFPSRCIAMITLKKSVSTSFKDDWVTQLLHTVALAPRPEGRLPCGSSQKRRDGRRSTNVPDPIPEAQAGVSQPVHQDVPRCFRREQILENR